MSAVAPGKGKGTGACGRAVRFARIGGMNRRFRLPVPFAVLVAACATGCLRTCSTDPIPISFFTGVHEDATAGRLDDLPRRLAANPGVDFRVDQIGRAHV